MDIAWIFWRDQLAMTTHLHELYETLIDMSLRKMSKFCENGAFQ